MEGGEHGSSDQALFVSPRSPPIMDMGTNQSSSSAVTACLNVPGRICCDNGLVVSFRNPARAFLAAALTVLRREHVLPTPRSHPFLRIGRDYFGASLMHLAEFAALESAIADSHPRFNEDTPLMNRDFANGYVFSFLEAFVAEAAISGEPLSPDASCFNACLESLVSAVEADSWETACCREVNDLTTDDHEPFVFEGVTVVPLTAPPEGHRREADRAIADVIPHAQSSYGRNRPHGWHPPHSVLVTRADSPNPFDSASELTGQIDRFLFVARLLHAGTCESLYEVQGGTALVRPFSPSLVQFRGSAGSMSNPSLLRRTVRLGARDVGRFAGLADVLAQVEGRPHGVLLSSFGMAKHWFQMSYHAHAWFEQVIGLAIALEAALSGTGKTDVLLRLKTRASALLATENDPAGAIFKDIGLLYELRSRLIHGSALTEKRLARSAASISTVPDQGLAGLAVAHAVDRLRDLVRRALLARICLATSDPPLWRLGEDEGVDAMLADSSTRSEWSSVLREVLVSFDARESIDRPRVAVEFVSREDR